MLKSPMTKSNTSSRKMSWRSQNTGTYIHIVKAKYSKVTAIIKLNGEKLKAVPLKSERRLCYPLSSYLFNTVLKVLARSIIKQKEIVWGQTRKEEVELFLFVDDIIV